MGYGRSSLGANDVEATITDEGLDRPEHPQTQVGRYRLGALIGAGGGGTVFEATDPQLDRRVALKVIAIDDTCGRGAGRLLREARVLAQLNHPNVITVLDVGQTEGSVFIAMELIEGTSLQQWRDGKERSWREIIGVYTQAARGLQAAHDLGLVHRDFKPDNAMIDEEGRVRVVDFGLALPWEGAPPPSKSGTTWSETLGFRLTRTGAMVGTPAFMAPEQFERGRLTPAADQFSWALCVYEALYGASSFGGTTLEERLRAVTGDAPRPPPTRTAVPGRVWRVLRRCLARTPAARWPSIGAAADALGGRNTPRRWAIGLSLAVATTVGAAALSALSGSRSDPDTPGSEAQSSRAKRAGGSMDQSSRAKRTGGSMDQSSRAKRAGGSMAQTQTAPTPLMIRTRRVVEQVLDGEQTLAECDAIIVEAEDHGEIDPKLECLSARAWAKERLGDSRGAREDFATLYSSAVEHRRHHHAATAALFMAYFRRVEFDFEGATQNLRYAEAALEHAPNPGVAADVDLEYATIAIGEGDLAAAERRLRSGLARLQHSTDDSRNLESRLRRSFTQVLVATEHYEEALDEIEADLALTLDMRGEDNVDTAAARMNLGVVLALGGERELGFAIMEDACDHMLLLGGAHHHAAQCLKNLADYETERDNYGVALDHLHRARELLEVVAVPDHPELASVHRSLATALVHSGRYDAALPHLRHSVRISEAAGGAHDPSALEGRVQLGDTLARAERWEEARSVLRAVVRAYEAANAPPEHRLWAMVSLARVSPDPKAVSLLERVLADELFASMLPYERGTAHLEMVRRLEAMGDLARARELAAVAEGQLTAADLPPFERRDVLEPLRHWRRQHPG